MSLGKLSKGLAPYDCCLNDIEIVTSPYDMVCDLDIVKRSAETLVVSAVNI